MTNLDQISTAIGRLQQAQESQIRQNDAIWNELKDISDALDVVHSNRDRLDRIEPLVDDITKIKNKGLGMLAALVFISAIIGASLGKSWVAIKGFFQ